MIAWWWLIPALFVGAFIGVFIAALAAASSTWSKDDKEAEFYDYSKYTK